MEDRFIGAGWAFPLRVDSGGGIALVRHHEEIDEAIRLVLSTSPGERPMRPDFGCGIHDYVFAPADATTAGRIEFEVRAALHRWEPRVDLVEVDVTVDDLVDGTLYIDISYQLRGTNDVRNLVFPFYTLPSEG